MKNRIFLLVIFALFSKSFAQTQHVKVEKSESGMWLTVDNKKFMVNGVNWDYVPIGSNITDPGIWAGPEDIIKKALDAEMALLKNMGVNAIRTYNLPPKWVKYIYENYGIYTMLNITFGAYGLTINGAWTPQTNYADPATREILMKEATDMANTYKNTPGLLLYMIGNENNYHLSWTSAETEDIPIEGSDDPNKIAAARALYKAFNDASKEVKAIDAKHPVAICNGDLLYIDLVKEECTDVDIYGTNMYRGISFGDAFQRVKDELNMPILFAEFGSDAFNAAKNEEDQEMQAYYDVGNWRDIYSNAAGMGRAGNSLGGFTFQFSDGWWKYKQTEDFDVHNNNASWHNGGYRDYDEPGQNNMNEEWFGICAKGPTNEQGLYTLYPRAAYYALKEVHEFNVYAPNTTAVNLDHHFDKIQVVDAMLRARGDKAALTAGGNGSKVRISRLSAQFTTFNTGGSLITTPNDPDPTDNTTIPNELGFDHMQSYFVGIEANPSPNMRANVEFNVLGNVARNPINEVFYENRGRPFVVDGPDGQTTINDPERVAVYNASFDWNHEYFDLDGFFRTGHYHWGYEGDFFGLYPEANYGPNLDIYNGQAPLGIEVEGKKMFKGLTLAFGPELWWGANPALLLKYRRQVGKFNVTGIFHEDLDQPGGAVTSIAIPQPKTRRATLAIERDFGKFGVTLGGIWAGQPLVDREFQNAVGDNGNYTVFIDRVKSSDTWGGRIKLTYEGGRFNWYGMASAQGLVANGGGDWTQTFTGWRLKDTGSGNVTSVLSGFTYNFGNLQVAPNFMWQKPIVDPMPGDVGGAGRLRNILEDPFVVRANRETVAGELLLTWDPTPASWFYQWDNDRAEDAKFAMNLGFVFRHLPTSLDAAIGFNERRQLFVFDGAPPAEDLWEVHSRMVSKVNSNLGMIANFYAGNAQANGSDPRLIHRYGMDLRVIYKKLKFVYGAKFNDWGPFDYHRDFNLTFPVQLSLDVSTTLGKQDWFILPNTRIGVMGTWRSLDQYSPRYLPNETAEFETDPLISPVGFGDGNEWEIRTYIHINIGR